MQLNIQDRISWEVMIYAHYIARDNENLFSDKSIRKHGVNALPPVIKEGMFYMPKKAKSNGNTSNFKPVAWVNTTLSDEDGNYLSGWDASDSELLGALIMLVETGHTVTCKPVSGEDSFMAAAIGATDECVNDGLGLSAYSDTGRDAIKALVYKHFQLHDQTWPKAEHNSKRKFR